MQNQKKDNKTPINSLKEIRIQKLKDIESQGINAYPHIYKPTHLASNIIAEFGHLQPGEKTADTKDIVKIAGRIMAIRNSGMFIDVEDESGKIQICNENPKADTQFNNMLKNLDIGDIIGVLGGIKKTLRGAVSVTPLEVTMLSKSLNILPEKYHGLTDSEERYRNKSVDLIVNKNSRDVVLNRAKAMYAIREVMHDEGYIEVETPILHPVKAGANAAPFTTHYNSLKDDFYLRIASELELKRLIVGGIPRVFEIGKNFRNEGIDNRHSPEFTMLDIYGSYKDYFDMMILAERLLRDSSMAVNSSLHITWKDALIDLEKPFKRLPMVDAASEALNEDLINMSDREIHSIAQKHKIRLKGTESWGKVVETIFEEKVEKTLIQPTFVMDVPYDISPLTKIHRQNPRLSERFMLYVGGIEFGEAYSELSNPIDQRKKFEEQASLSDDPEAMQMDEAFLTALEYGMPPTGGMGIGADRLAMMLTNSSNIRDVLTFPMLKKIKLR